jgi:hypothetical protein
VDIPPKLPKRSGAISKRAPWLVHNIFIRKILNQLAAVGTNAKTLSYLTQEDLQAITNPVADFNTDFSVHLPRYQKSAHPCDYCRSKALECFIYDCDGTGRVRCSPCNALFRPCSFSDTEKMPALRQKTALDTLDVVGEDDERCFGGLTGRKQMRVRNIDVRAALKKSN